MRKKIHVEPPTIGVNLVPMLDCIFNLLIFFLCSPYKTAEGELDAFLPKNLGINAGQAKVEDLITVVVRLKYIRGQEAPKVYIGSTAIAADETGQPSYDTLYSKLVALAGMGAVPPPVEIQSDRLVRYQHVINTMDACCRAKIKDIRFSLPMGRPGDEDR